MATLSPTAVSLQERILDSFPSGDYAITALLQLVDIVESDAVESAAVECVTSPRMLINPAFVAAHCQTSDTLLMLVMHELHHVLLGHTRQFPRVTQIDNLVFDAVINSMLCRTFPDLSCRRFFTDLYCDDRFPDCLLRPPKGWSPGMKATHVPVPPALAGEEMERAARVYRSLYSEGGASYRALYRILAREVQAEAAEGVVLVGGHEKWITEGISPSEPSVVFEIVENLKAKWPEAVDPVRGQSLGDLLEETRLATKRLSRSNRFKLRELMQRVGGCRHARSGKLGRERTTVEGQVMGPIPSGDRRGVVMRNLGWPPLLHTNSIPCSQQGHDRLSERVHVYVDVSGSIGGLKGALYGSVIDCGDMVHSRVHLFSTEVHDVTLKQLRQGVCHTTGGTDINCVAGHMRRHSVRRAVLVTDGYVWQATQPNRNTLSDVRLGVALCTAESTRGYLGEFTAFWTELDL